MLSHSAFMQVAKASGGVGGQAGQVARNELLPLLCVIDLRHSGERAVGGHDCKGKAAALVTAYGRGLPRPAL